MDIETTATLSSVTGDPVLEAALAESALTGGIADCPPLKSATADEPGPGDDDDDDDDQSGGGDGGNIDPDDDEGYDDDEDDDDEEPLQVRSRI